ncbi:site-specific integrase [Pseudomonas aeruginosa]|uniref:site-specific integrase n=11 Tax=Pseudomonas aeruginosa TaxID=287 RepID=UPI00053E0B72|nr:site-specific integrase [Pseudomonas aeruginosa]EIU3787620.1 site-specific integrase [Pseudomonas aeruginosa]EKV0492048.1 site-specific integrase [Pseudomonas aeruginosa]MCQ9778531.1 tyrosine-type recombinase/integrase [Pseudomonas aeruginosa]MCQ9832770.1 tyrosine-type recombinase/integrase [Pseudomonas aeruginosa]MCQ9847907.1 tyrosine-type recombinase/integrase [Pseudomonas aeruginosa]
MTPQQLTEEYIFAHDLREASAKIYRAATKALLKHFGPTATVQDVDHRAVLGWRRNVLEQGLSKRSWNTYSNHLRTIWGYAIEHELVTHSQVNPFRKTTVIPPRRASKTVAAEAILRARNWLNMQVGAERCTGDRARITPAWFWLCTFEVFYFTGIRLNALLCIRKRDIDWENQLILIRGETEKTHKEFVVPITEGLVPHLSRLLQEADRAGFADDDQLFNVNRFSPHYKSKVMNSDQVEAMYRKLTEKVGVRMTPHRFRHTLATDLMKAPERNIHLTKCLLNHSNIQTTMSYIEADYDHMRAVLHARSLAQGALENVRKVDYSGSPQASAKPKPCGQPLARMGEAPPQEARTEPAEPREHTPGTGIQGDATAWEEALPQPPDTFEQSVLFTLMAQHLSNRAASASAAPAATSGSGGSGGWGSAARSNLA